MQLIPVYGGPVVGLGKGRGTRSGGKVVAYAMVDDAHFAKLSKFSFHLKKSGSGGYPVTRIHSGGKQSRIVYLHQMVWALAYGRQPKKPLEIDHKDKNKLNAQSANLREATPTLQRVNTGLRSDNTSGYKGVAFHKKTARWRAYVNVKRQIHLGLFTCKHAAARAVNAAYRLHYPEVEIPNPAAESRPSHRDGEIDLTEPWD